MPTYHTTEFTAPTAGVDADVGSDETPRGDPTVVEITDAPWQDAFDTDRFYRYEAVVARPISQTYTVRDEDYTFKKPATELQQAAWQLDNAPFTLGHPDTGVVRDAEDVHGFWRDPEYVHHDDRPDEQRVTLYVPVTDDEAVSWLDSHRATSVGFYNDLDWDTDDPDVDAYQRNIVYDHVAGVEQGRCSVEHGCEIVADGQPVTALDGRTPTTKSGQEMDAEDVSEGDWVQWGSRGGPVYGQVDEVVREGCTTRGTGDVEVCAEDGDPAVVIEVYDNDADKFTGDVVRHKASTLSSWTDPTADHCPGPTCSCGCHTARQADADGSDMAVEDIDLSVPDGAQSAAQAYLDARDDGLVGDDCGTGAGTESARMIADGSVTPDRLVSDIAPYLNSHEADTTRDDHPTQWPDDAWQDCGDAQYAAWGWHSLTDWARRHADMVKRARGEAPVYTDANDDMDGAAPRGLYVDDEGNWYGVGPSENPDGDPKYELNDCDDVQDAYNLRNNGDYDIETDTLVDRIERAADAHDCPPEFRPWTDSTSDGLPTALAVTPNWTCVPMSDDDTNFSLDVADLSVDALADRHEGVARLQATVDEKNDRIDDLEATIDELEGRIDSLQDSVDERVQQRVKRRTLVDDITDMTDRWDEDAMLDAEDGPSLAVLEERHDLLVDANSSVTTVTDSVDTDGDDAVTTDGTDDDVSGTRLGRDVYDLSNTA